MLTMRRFYYRSILFLSFVLIVGAAPPEVLGGAITPAGDRLKISGELKNPKGRAVHEVEVKILLNGQQAETMAGAPITTNHTGIFQAELILPAGTLPECTVEVTAFKTAWKQLPPTAVPVQEIGVDTRGNRLFQAQGEFGLTRTITPAFWIAAAILLLVYGLIASELMHRTLAALLGATLVLFVTYTAGTFKPDYFILSFEDAIAAIDMNVIFLLMGMMIIVGILKKTGMFQWLAFKSYALARGNIFILSTILMVVTAILSAFLDNVTTMLLILPVTIEIAATLKINPLTLLIPEVFASNVGGAATLIGDPPNILIGSYANLTFMDFVVNLTLICTVCMAISLVYYLFWYRRGYQTAVVKDLARTMQEMETEYRIHDKKLALVGVALLCFTIFLFVIHGVLKMEISIAALTGAMFLLAISRVDIVEILEHEVEWPTLIFFIALFMVIAGAEETGLIQIVAEWVRDLSKGDLTRAVILVLWVSAISSAFMGNISSAATLLPVVAFLNNTIPGAETGILWWALALGACLGGNGTMIGAAANVVTVGLAEKAGFRISFFGYIKACFIPMLITVALANAFLLTATFVRPVTMSR